MGRVITSVRFADVLAAAGIVHDLERISEIRVIARAGHAVMIEVTYFGDERLLTLGRQPEDPDASPE